MGLFIAMSGIAETNRNDVAEVLRDYATQHSGTFEVLTSDSNIQDDELLIVADSKQGNITVMYPNGFLNWDNVSQFLSDTLQKPVFSFHIHDSDLWMYLLFDNGVQIDQFNPIPDYWNEDSNDDFDLQSWAGNAKIISQHWPNIRPEKIEKYLIRWENYIDEASNMKAYPEDEFEAGIDWQMADFMAKVGLVLPADEAEKNMSRVMRARFSIPDTKTTIKPPKLKKLNWWQRFLTKASSPTTD
jgi:hypothetical protein